MERVIAVNPFRCRMWVEHERLSEKITEESCRAEIDSFLTHGQLLPVLGRPVRGDNRYEVELIYGARRLFVCRHLNTPVLVELRELSDKEGIIALEIENRQRKDLSPYERGLSYVRWLRAGHFSSQEDVARALNISPSQVSRLMKLARLPSVVINAFESPLDICEGWGLDLFNAWNDGRSQRSMADTARGIAGEAPRPNATQVYARLMPATVRARKSRTKVHDEVVKDSQGRPLFRVRHHRHDVALLLPATNLSDQLLTHIKHILRDALQHTTRQDVVTEDQLPKVTSRRATRDIESRPL